MFLKVEAGVKVHDPGAVLGGKGTGIFNVQDKVAVEDDFQGSTGREVEVVASGGVDVFVVKFRKRSGTVGQIEVPQGADSIAEATEHQANILSPNAESGELPTQLGVHKTGR